MGTENFWTKLDEGLVSLSQKEKWYVMGPRSLGSMCCNTCSMAELDFRQTSDGLNGDQDTNFLYYHDQERDRNANEVYLGWDGPEVLESVYSEFTERGLTVILPQDISSKIVVKE
jgi:hypothetical protein